MDTHWRLNLTDKTKDRVLNTALLGALSLLIVSFSYSSTPKKVGQPGSPTYNDAKLAPVSSYLIRTYQPFKPLSSGDHAATDSSGTVSMVQLIEPTHNPIKPTQPSKKKTSPVLNPVHTPMPLPIIPDLPDVPVTTPVIDTLNNVLDQTPLVPIVDTLNNAL